MAALLSALTYGIFSLDHFSVGPFLLSRPLVLGGVVGFLFGNPAQGVALGLFAECLWVMVPPSGAGQWDVGLAVALAGVWAFEGTVGARVKGSELALAFILSIPFAVVGRRVDHWMRRHTRVFAVRALAGVERGVVGPLRYGLIFGAVLWGFKSLVIFFLAQSLGGGVFHGLLPLLAGPWEEGLSLAWRLWPALGLAALLHHFSSRLRRSGWSLVSGGPS
ncbi:MAG: PTS sugar transporter subunit IIC [Elusimicrobia bacterium]|jgi:mannose/fructose/N-acetylgalactosamine-specific phosphotransferase system component IIC|nr:PTS sugar transporter subunit IIC [Elusimicrobiota bacterium]